MVRCIQTLFIVVRAPNAFARRVAEPVDHGTMIGFLATLRLPLWGVVVLGLLARALLRDPERPVPLETTALGDLIGMQLAHALSLYLLLLVPLLLPALYLVCGELAHLALAMTGGARRSIGATMRAVGYATTPLLLVVGALEIPLRLTDLDPDLWAWVAMAAALPTLVFVGMALARTHDTSLGRGLLCAILPLAFVGVTVVGRAMLDMPRAPFSPPVEVSPYAPFPLPPLE